MRLEDRNEKISGQLTEIPENVDSEIQLSDERLRRSKKIAELHQDAIGDLSAQLKRRSRHVIQQEFAMQDVARLTLELLQLGCYVEWVRNGSLTKNRHEPESEEEGYEAHDYNSWATPSTQ